MVETKHVRHIPALLIPFSYIYQSMTVLKDGDVLKVDIGVQVKGRICDSAFTLTFDHTYDKLLEAVQASTNTGVRVRVITVFSRKISSGMFRKQV
jgi:methionine aminopeptidase